MLVHDVTVVGLYPPLPPLSTVVLLLMVMLEVKRGAELPPVLSDHLIQPLLLVSAIGITLVL